jgi:hypothetical protein
MRLPFNTGLTVFWILFSNNLGQCGSHSPSLRFKCVSGAINYFWYIFDLYWIKSINKIVNKLLEAKTRYIWTQWNCLHVNTLRIYMYCEIIIIRVVLIFTDFVVHLNHENKNKTKYNFPIDLPVMFETTSSRTHGSMHFVETKKIGANE